MNREFLRQDQLNQRNNYEIIQQRESEVANEYSVLEFMKDNEGQMIKSII